MKRLLAFSALFIFLYSTYYDLTIGTLPNGLSTLSSEEVLEHDGDLEEDPEVSVITQEPYERIRVQPGQTVLSVVEHLHTGPIPATIQEIIYDFKELNGIEPEEMQIGQEYLFPLYH
ncbi:hypothetical protein [Bacillus sp. JCM 19034]|uniref:hypothetical protein n=1 Tax=Bacillus sp. JCM 19034 TaxID=1481928 RepID=UPI00078098E2|nr:hypothetical protein [Bacillus sp. JCM 19034]